MVGIRQWLVRHTHKYITGALASSYQSSSWMMGKHLSITEH